MHHHCEPLQIYVVHIHSCQSETCGHQYFILLVKHRLSFAYPLVAIMPEAQQKWVPERSPHRRRDKNNNLVAWLKARRLLCSAEHMS